MSKFWHSSLFNWILSSISCLIFCFIGYHLAYKVRIKDEFETRLLKTQCQENPDFSLVVTVYNVKTGTVTCEYQGKRYYEPSRNPQKKAGK